MLYEVEYSTKYPEPTLQKGWAYGSKEYDLIRKGAVISSDGTVGEKAWNKVNFWLICNPTLYKDKNSNIRFHGNIQRHINGLKITGRKVSLEDFESSHGIQVSELIEEWEEDLTI